MQPFQHRPEGPACHSILDDEYDDPRTRARRPRKPRQRATPSDAPPATVTSILRGHCRVLHDGQEILCPLPRDASLAPGDRVRMEGPRLREVLPRTSTLWRSDPSQPAARKVLAANVDLGLVVVTLREPTLRLRLIDRFLLVLQRGGIQPVICVNKIDLVDADPDLDRLQPYRDLGIPVVPCSAATGAGIEDLADLLAGRTGVLVGHSGVGKTSLAAALGAPSRATDELQRGQRGRHCTTVSQWASLPQGGALLDTPGVRELGLGDLGPAEVAEGFPDLLAHAAGCRFSDCTHGDEPACAVREAARKGEVSPARYHSYRRLLGDNPDETDSFRCGGCGYLVPTSGAGSEHRNHCPRCLHSRHLDLRPGDRAACCGEIMDPVAVWVRADSEWALIHRCRGCGALGSNRIAADDNELLLLSLAVRPLSQPPFPLDRLP